MTSFINPPTVIPFYLRFGLWLVRRVIGKDLLPAQLLTWYPKAAISSGILEALIAHSDGQLTERLLKLVRLQVSFLVACPFCTDLNSVNTERFNISADEVTALRGQPSLETVQTLTTHERLALVYARAVSQTPPDFPPNLMADLKTRFNEREIVILATTIAQVNYWARLSQGLGVPSAEFSGQCTLPHQIVSPLADRRI